MVRPCSLTLDGEWATSNSCVALANEIEHIGFMQMLMHRIGLYWCTASTLEDIEDYRMFLDFFM